MLDFSSSLVHVLSKTFILMDFYLRTLHWRRQVMGVGANLRITITKFHSSDNPSINLGQPLYYTTPSLLSLVVVDASSNLCKPSRALHMYILIHGQIKISVIDSLCANVLTLKRALLNLTYCHHDPHSILPNLNRVGQLLNLSVVNHRRESQGVVSQFQKIRKI